MAEANHFPNELPFRRKAVWGVTSVKFSPGHGDAYSLTTDDKCEK